MTRLLDVGRRISQWIGTSPGVMMRLFVWRPMLWCGGTSLGGLTIFLAWRHISRRGNAFLCDGASHIWVKWFLADKHALFWNGAGNETRLMAETRLMVGDAPDGRRRA